MGFTPDNITVLLRAGANLEMRGVEGLTPLHAAAIAGTAASVVILLEASASGRAKTVGGKTPFDLAAENPSVMKS